MDSVPELTKDLELATTFTPQGDGNQEINSFDFVQILH